MTLPSDIVGAAVRSIAGRKTMEDRDRVLVAVTMAIATVVLAWPRRGHSPRFLHKSADLGRSVWNRRSWWTNPAMGTITDLATKKR